MQKIALITGITGQDGGYLADLLLSKGYEVHGLQRWDAIDGTARLSELGVLDKCAMHWGDMTDPCALMDVLLEVKPCEVYNLASLSDVAVSFVNPSCAFSIGASGTLNLLEALRISGLSKTCRFYQASSSEMFGSARAPQNENTRFEPCSPYGVAKLAAYWLVRTYRDAYGMHASNGILFNHESPLRGQEFVTRKIAKAVARMSNGDSAAPLMLGNLDAKRDWGHARDYVRGMWLMLQSDAPDDYVLASGASYTVRECASLAFACAGIEIKWQGAGKKEVGLCAKSGKTMIAIDESLFRPKEVPFLLGDPTKAREKLGWSPQISFKDLIKEMVLSELSLTA